MVGQDTSRREGAVPVYATLDTDRPGSVQTGQTSSISAILGGRAPSVITAELEQ